MYRFGGWFEAGSASCPTARSWCFGGGFDSRWARRLARRLARGASAEDSIQDWPGVLLDGSLASLRRRMRFETGPASCPTARSRRFGGGFDSIRARRLARRLACGTSADGSVETGPAYCPTARSWRFGRSFGLRRARHLARRLTRVSLRQMVRDGPCSLPDGSLVYRFGACQTARATTASRVR